MLIMCFLSSGQTCKYQEWRHHRRQPKTDPGINLDHNSALSGQCSSHLMVCFMLWTAKILRWFITQMLDYSWLLYYMFILWIVNMYVSLHPLMLIGYLNAGWGFYLWLCGVERHFQCDRNAVLHFGIELYHSVSNALQILKWVHTHKIRDVSTFDHKVSKLCMLGFTTPSHWRVQCDVTLVFTWLT